VTSQFFYDSDTKVPHNIADDPAKKYEWLTTQRAEKVEGVADKMRRGEKPVGADQKRIAYAITAAYLDQSGELARLQDLAKNGADTKELASINLDALNAGNSERQAKINGISISVAALGLPPLIGEGIGNAAVSNKFSPDALKEIAQFAKAMHVEGVTTDGKLTQGEIEGLQNKLHVKATGNIDNETVQAMNVTKEAASHAASSEHPFKAEALAAVVPYVNEFNADVARAHQTQETLLNNHPKFWGKDGIIPHPANATPEEQKSFDRDMKANNAAHTDLAVVRAHMEGAIVSTLVKNHGQGNELTSNANPLYVKEIQGYGGTVEETMNGLLQNAQQKARNGENHSHENPVVPPLAGHASQQQAELRTR
jgi:hypothetical protein